MSKTKALREDALERLRADLTVNLLGRSAGNRLDREPTCEVVWSLVTKLPPLAFEISRTLDSNQTLVLACSGGLDSVVLVDLFSKFADRKNLALSIGHIHHGPCGTNVRDEARTFVDELARKYGLPFFTRESNSLLKSEAELREFRKHALREILQEVGAEKLVFAHHADDLIETRLMRLIRGTGPQGLEAMRAKTKTALRPLLNTSQATLRLYAREQNLEHRDDPSNRDERFFRNWIRNSWLPQLETTRPGSINALGRSLDLLAESLSLVPEPFTKMSRVDFHRLTLVEKRQKLASLTHSRQVRDFGRSRIIEVLKRLEGLEVSRQKFCEFQVGGLTWVVTPHEIEIR